MKLSEVEFKAKDFLDYELKDGYGDGGGIPHEHYTLEDYLEEIAEDEDDYDELVETDIYEINNILVIESGIAPIPYNFEKERQQFACMIAGYIGAFSNGEIDSIAVYQECIDYGNNYDFEIYKEEDNGKYVIDTEVVREDAIAFAKEKVEELMENMER